MTVQLLADRPRAISAPSVPGTAAQAAGIAHEERMHRQFEEYFRLCYLAAPWFRYQLDFGGWRYCQPDGLLLFPNLGRVVICEAKLAHTPASVGQLNRYSRVVAALLPKWDVATLEVVRFYKGAGVDGFKIPVRLVLRPEGAKPGIFNVMILSKW